MSDYDDEEYEDEDDEQEEECDEDEDSDDDEENDEEDEDNDGEYYDEDEEEEDSEEYECRNKGCDNQNGTTFIAAPSEWFKSKGLSTPTNCPDCKEWINEQKEEGPITAVCAYCGYVWQVSAEFRISYHKYTGDWADYWKNEAHRSCQRCIAFPNRRTKLKIRHAEKALRDALLNREIYDGKSAEEIQQNDTDRHTQDETILATASYPLRFDVPSAISFYLGIKTREDRINDHGETQLDHIMKKKHNWSALADMEHPETVLSVASSIARSQSPSICQFDAGNGVIAKYCTDQMITVLIKEDPYSTSGVRIETAFPTESGYVINKIDKGHWK